MRTTQKRTLRIAARHALALASAAVCAMAGTAQAQALPSAVEQVQQVYVAFYGRPGDPGGVAYWASRVGAGGIAEVLDQFSGSLEAGQLFAGMSDEGKITFIYRVLFNRDPDGPGLSYWGGELSSGKRSLQEISFEILKGARNEDLGKIVNKVAAAQYFSNELVARNIQADYSVQADIFLARNWLSTIDETPASLDRAKQAIHALLDRISLAGTPQTVTGVVAFPADALQSARSAIRYMPQFDHEDLRRQAAQVLASPAPAAVCFGVPDGYSPLAHADITQIDAFDQQVGTAATADACGMFVLPTAPMTTQLALSAPGYRPVQTPLTVFQDPDKNGLPDALTLIPTTSHYQLTGLRLSSGNQLYFNVTDSATKKAVLGLSSAQISVSNNSAPMPISAMGYGASISNKPASVALVLDASGSMYGTPLQVAAASARLFVGRKSSADELSMTIFDNRVSLLDKATTDAMVNSYRLQFTDGSNRPVQLNAPSNGYTTSPLFAEQILKLYDNNSDAWTGTDPFFRIQGWYPFGGSTALYKASVTGIDSLEQSTNRRYAVVMTDGEDNASWPFTVNSVIDAAKSKQVATHTIAAGTYVNAQHLQRIAQETGGTYTQVQDMTQLARLSSVFDAIRTSITFDYAAVLGKDPAAGDLRMRLDLGGGEVVEAQIMVP